jgi:hypothetical protein
VVTYVKILTSLEELVGGVAEWVKSATLDRSVVEKKQPGIAQVVLFVAVKHP